jgi:hypothetical protein
MVNPTPDVIKTIVNEVKHSGIVVFWLCEELQILFADSHSRWGQD